MGFPIAPSIGGLKMAKPKTAKVTLTGSRSHTHMGRTLVKGKPQIISNPSEIRYYQGVQGVSVKILRTEESDKKKSSKTASKKKKAKKYKKAELTPLKKPALTKIAKKQKILLSGEETKKELVEAILANQSLG
jgi:ribosomal protein S3